MVVHPVMLDKAWLLTAVGIGLVSLGVVQGASLANSAGADIALIKYHSNGTRLWSKLYGSAEYDDWAYAISIYNNFIYIAGGTSSTTFNGLATAGIDNSFALKLTTSGTTVWTRVEGTADGGTMCLAVVVDSVNSFVYIGGYSGESLNGAAYPGGMLLVKYNLDGTRISTKFSGVSQSDTITALAVDGSTGDLYVFGYVNGAVDGQTYAGSGDTAIIKYASNGTRIWTRLFGTTTPDDARGIALGDSSTNAVFIVGQTYASIDGETYSGGASPYLARYSKVVVQPTLAPSLPPTRLPSGQPTSQPSSQPTRQPTGQPTGKPFGQPTGQPTRQPTGKPSGLPSNAPSRQPTCQPTGKPTVKRTPAPSFQPTIEPTLEPTLQPTLQSTALQLTQTPTDSEAGTASVCKSHTYHLVATQAEFRRHRCFPSRP